MDNAEIEHICPRIAQIRVELFGPRGKSAFAKQLGLSPSTYDYYESKRVPPADVLLRIAEIAGVDLRWLLTGQAPGGPDVRADDPIIQRAAALLAERPDAAKPLAAFVEVLAESLKFPAKAVGASGGAEAAAPAAADAYPGLVGDAEPAAAAAGAGAGAETSWIPVLGRSAAGVAQFWSDQDGAAGVTTLGHLIARHAGRSPQQVCPAKVSGEADVDATVQIITLAAADAGPPDEFIAAPATKARYPDAFAVRLDGGSMAPEMRHGDLLVLSPSEPAVDGRAAVIQLERQVGVTCKLFRRAGDLVHLVPVNEQFPPQCYPADGIVWALRVLATVRP